MIKQDVPSPWHFELRNGDSGQLSPNKQASTEEQGDTSEKEQLLEYQNGVFSALGNDIDLCR